MADSLWGDGGGATSPSPFPSSSVIDADEVVRPERPPSHPVKVEVDDEVLRRPAALGLGPEGIGGQVEAGRARCGARLSADLVEGELHDACGEAGTERASEVRHGGLLQGLIGSVVDPYA